MRLALFEISEVPCAIALEKILHIMTSPHVFSLPLLSPRFAGGLVYQGQVVPLLASGHCETQDGITNLAPAFTLVCEAEFGIVGIPADTIERITKIGEAGCEAISECNSQDEVYEISGREYRILDLNEIIEDPAFSIAG